MPDIFVPEDTTGITSYYKEAAMSGLLMQFAFEYTDANRNKLSSQKSVNALLSYLKSQNLVEQFATYADKHGLQRRNLMIHKSHTLLERFLYGRIIYNILDEQALHEYVSTDDPVIKQALKVLQDGDATPKLKKEEKGTK